MNKYLNSQKQIAMLLARRLRRNQTDAELKFWKALKRNKLYDHKFLRQHPLYYEFYGKTRFFIADFFCNFIVSAASKFK